MSFTIPEDTIAIAHLTHSGAGNFVVFGVNPDGSRGELIGAKSGVYAGTVLFHYRGHSVGLDVTADGPWTAEIEYFTAAPVWDGTSPLTGTGDEVYLVFPQTTELTHADAAHLGSANFIVTGYTAERPHLLVNEQGDYSDEILLPSGLAILQVVADGDWRFDPQ